MWQVMRTTQEAEARDGRGNGCSLQEGQDHNEGLHRGESGLQVCEPLHRPCTQLVVSTATWDTWTQHARAEVLSAKKPVRTYTP